MTNRQSSANPSLKQMRARMTESHRAGLRNMAKYGTANPPGCIGVECGSAAFNTLVKWGAIAQGGLTEIGKALLSSSDTGASR